MRTNMSTNTDINTTNANTNGDSDSVAQNIIKIIAKELAITATQVTAAITLLDNGDTVPFISRYRKEVTGGLSDTQLRDLVERLTYLRELEERRAAIVKSIEEQGKLTIELKDEILAADNKARLEDLYLPYKPKRRTKAQIAREAGLEPLAHALLNNPNLVPEEEAAKYVTVIAVTAADAVVAAGAAAAIATTAQTATTTTQITTSALIAPATQAATIDSVAAALEGARQILMEEFAEHAELVGKLRDYLWQHGSVTSQVAKNKEEHGIKFSDYFAFCEPIKKIPSHRALALFRGRNEEVLHLALEFVNANKSNASESNNASNNESNNADKNSESYIINTAKNQHCLDTIATTFNISDKKRPADAWLQQVVAATWKIKLHTKLELELMNQLREHAEEEAIKVFANNLKNLLMAAPAGNRVTLGLDPGLRTGVKAVVIDNVGRLLEYTTIFPHQPRNAWDEAIATLAILCRKHQVTLISIGNGTASRETERLVGELQHCHPELQLTRAIVSEAGASVYSASSLAAAEFPTLDVSYRGAVSIARRLQDPLAELVKIDPKAIGVGQYQHDVNQTHLAISLSTVMEDCVNAVGADVNTASVQLLSSIAGLTASIAKNIVAYREQHGRFTRREDLQQVPRLGAKSYEQAIGFLRIIGGANPLDSSSVHPEAYPIVEKILQHVDKGIKEVMGNTELIKTLRATDYINERFGEPTIKDIFNELLKPGRDPRPEFKTATFKEGVETIEDLVAGMTLEGTVTNVTNFGAFVDIGVHQDGLVHISNLANRFIPDPYQVVKVGQIVQVEVLSVDPKRKRIALTMRTGGDKAKANPNTNAIANTVNIANTAKTANTANTVTRTKTMVNARTITNTNAHVRSKQYNAKPREERQQSQLASALAEALQKCK